MLFPYQTAALSLGGNIPAPYSGAQLWPSTYSTSAPAPITNKDLLLGFYPKADIEIDSLVFYGTATAGNVYTGIYDENGDLVTDAAIVAALTSAKTYAPITPVTLLANRRYYFAASASDGCVGRCQTLNTDQNEVLQPVIGDYMSATRAHSALLSSVDLSTFTRGIVSTVAAMGVTIA